MKILKKLCFVLALLLSINTLTFASNDTESVEKYTTTRINDWLVNYHLTSKLQVDNKIKGADSAQNTFAYTISKHDDNIHLMATNTTSIYRSEDGGASWVTSCVGIEQNGCNTLMFHPDMPNVVFATVFCGNNSVKNPAGDGVYKSEDYGKTWRKVLQKYYYSQTRGSENIAFSEPDKDGSRIIYASTYRDGVYRSLDNGETWELLSLEGTILRGINYNEGVISVWGNESGLFQSTDGGATFEKRTSGLKDDTIVYSLAVNPTNSSHVICVSGTPAVLYESFDKGVSWAYIESDFGGFSSEDKADLRTVKFGAVDTDGSVSLYISIRQCQYNIRCSTDYGRTFVKPKLDLTYAVINNITGWFEDAFCPHPNKPNVIMGTFNCFIFKSEDYGLNYVPSNAGFSGYVVQSMYFKDGDNGFKGYIGLTDRGMGKLFADEDTLYPIYENSKVATYESQGSCNYFAVNPNNVNHVIYVTGHTGYDSKTCFAVTKDGFKTSELLDVEYFGNKGFKFVYWHPTQTNIVYAGDSISYDYGETWESVGMEIACMSPIDGDIIYGTKKEGNNTSVYVSLDRGKNWISLGFSVYDLRQVKADLFDPYTVWVCARGLHKVECYKGITQFFGSDKGFPIFSTRVMQITGFAQDPNCKDHLILTGKDPVQNTIFPAIYESWDAGIEWKNIEGFPDMAAGTPMFHPTEPVVYFGTGFGTIVYEFENYKLYNLGDNQAKEETMEEAKQ